MTEWMSVKECLPYPYDLYDIDFPWIRVLICLNGGHVEIGLFDFRDEKYPWESDGVCPTYYKAHEVAFWAHLPQPPKNHPLWRD